MENLWAPFSMRNKTIKLYIIIPSIITFQSINIVYLIASYIHLYIFYNNNNKKKNKKKSSY